MPILSIGELEIDGVALGICKRSHDVNALGQVMRGFRVMVNGEPAQALVVAENGALLATDQEDFLLPWSTLAWDGRQLASPQLPNSTADIHLPDPDRLTVAIAEAKGEPAPQEAAEEELAEVARTGMCPDCEQVVSLRATTCVHCGAPLSTKVPVDSTDENKWRQSMLRNSDDQTRYLRSFWVVLLVFLIANLVIGVVVLATSSS